MEKELRIDRLTISPGYQKPSCCGNAMHTLYVRLDRSQWTPVGFHCLGCGSVWLLPK